MRLARIAVIMLLSVIVLAGVACGGSDSGQGGASCDIQWNQAVSHIGGYKTVCGHVAGTYYASTNNGQPTFLNIGTDYPDSSRFVVIIWGDDRHNFSWSPESHYLGKNIAVTGSIEEYEGCAEIVVSSPSQITEY